MIAAIDFNDHVARIPAAERIDREQLIRVRKIDGPLVYVSRDEFADVHVNRLALYNKDGSKVGGKASRVHRAALDPAGIRGADLNRNYARPSKVAKAFARSRSIDRQAALLRIAQDDVAKIAGCAIKGFNALSRLL